MRLLVLSILLACTLVLAHPAEAATLTRTLDGARFEMQMSCAHYVTIDPEPALDGKVEIEASAADPDELDPLEFAGGATARLGRRDDCEWISHMPMLKIAIRVPPATTLDLRLAGIGSYRIGAVGGALKLDLPRGIVDVEAMSASALDVLMAAGGARVKLYHLDGAGKIDVRGSGDVTIVGGTMPSLAIDLRNQGTVTVRTGEIGALAAAVTGAATIRIGGTVKDATLTASGAGTIEVAKATGAVKSHDGGSGGISVGR